ncbi:MAG: hypothetical protein Q4Q16_02305 [Methanobrevibacter sp.]|nr:hypothetical protein [Methanobrevibacter sp.]
MSINCINLHIDFLFILEIARCVGIFMGQTSSHDNVFRQCG